MDTFVSSFLYRGMKEKLTVAECLYRSYVPPGLLYVFLHIYYKSVHTMVQNLQEVESMGTEKMDTKQEQRNKENEEIREMGTMELGKKGNPYGIQLLTIIGEIEGHENVSGNTKATKYEHLLPRLAEAEENDEIEGVLILLNTMGGDVEAGLGIAEMIASLGKPTVITGPWRKSFYRRTVGCICRLFFYCPVRHDDYSSGRSSGMFIGVIQSYRNMERTQDRITRFIASHSHISQERIVELMLDSTQLVKDVGTMLEGEEAVREGMIDEVGGIHEAFQKLHELIDEERRKKKQEKPDAKPDHFFDDTKKN